MRKVTLYGKAAREKIMAGVDKISDAVSTTLGPMGRNVMISQSAVVDYGVHNLPLHITKDGYTVAKGFDLDDPHEKAGVLMAKECAQKSVDQAGDGTTTTIVLLRAIVKEGMRLIEEGANPMELKKGIDKAVEYVVEELKKMAVPIKGNVEKIRQIATVSANNDSEIGDLIAQAFEKIGEEGIIDIEASSSVKTEIKVAEGIKVSRGWLSPVFVNRREKQICEFENPLILLYEKRITHHTQLQKALEVVMSMGRPVVIICEDADQEGLAFLAVNNAQGRIQCCVIQSPEYGEKRREAMEDLAVITGGTYLSDISGVGIKDVKNIHFGEAKKVIVSKEETVIIGGKGDATDLLNELRMNLAQTKNEEERFPIEKRIAKLTGGVAVIQVGAATETEMKEKLDRFDDAVLATKAAISEGYVPGAGTAFLRIAQNASGINLVFGAILEPLKQIARNAGVDELVKTLSVTAASGNVGYNAKDDKIEDLVEAGIIDPVKVLRCAIQNAASSAGMMLTCETLIADTL